MEHSIENQISITPISGSKQYKKSKFIGVRQRPSGKWISEIKDTTQNIRMWLGTFKTPEEAARAYDEAACLLRGSNTRTNFPAHHQNDHLHSNSTILSLKIRSLLNHKMSVKNSTTIPKTNSAIKWSTPTQPTTNKLVKNQEAQMFDQEYRPDDKSMREGEVSPSHLNEYSWWPFPIGFDPYSTTNEGMDVPEQVDISASSDTVQTYKMSVLDCSRVERQISTSLYAVNEVNEFVGNPYDSDADWDIPASELYCPS